MQKDRIIIFDTTTRDGEQAGHKMSSETKVLYAKAAEQAGVDVLEAGFPISSPGDSESVKAVSAAVERMTVAALSRAIPGDIDAAWKAIKHAQHPRIHTFIATSDIHMQSKLRRPPKEILAMAICAVTYARS